MNQSEFDRRYRQLSHAMQSGVAYDHAKGSQDGTPKHLRVGVNNALRDHGSLVGLLVKKGVITEAEYFDAVIAGLEREVKEYELRLSERYGANITLG